MKTSNKTISNDQSTKTINDFFGSIAPKTKIGNYEDLRKVRLGELDNSSQTFFAIGEKARIQYWKVDFDRYTERYFLLSCPEFVQFINSYAKYLQKIHGIPKSTAYADVKVYEMLEPGNRREVLDKPIEQLNSYIRLFSTTDKKWHKKLIGDIEDFAKYSADDLKSYFKPIKDASSDWHDKLLGDIDKIAEKSTEIIAKLGNKPKSNLVVDAFNQAVTELVEGYVSSNTDSADTDEKQSDSDSPKESGDTE
ncbi:MAG: hypothetical protein HOK84_05090 [Bacteroidetes bacterium]|nr:hypothetical protein [Bacteroidota bacterium]